MPRMRISNGFLSVWELCYTTVTVHQIRSKRGRRLQFNSLNTAMLANAGEFAQNFDVGICWNLLGGLTMDFWQHAASTFVHSKLG